MAPTGCTPTFESGRVYCLTLRLDNETRKVKRLLAYRGADQAWEDLCSGDRVVVDPAQVEDVTEVPSEVVEAIRFAHRKEPVSPELPVNRWEESEEAEPWERDVYWDD